MARAYIVRRSRYRFSHRAGNYYYWTRFILGDSREEQIRCRVDWFWAPKAEADGGKKN